MQFFWEHGELSVAQVRYRLSHKRKVARNTVQTMLSRLVEKGWLQTRAEGKAFLFRASRPRKSTLRAMVGQILDDAFGGSPSRLVMTLLEARPISAEEAQSIRRLIDDMPEVQK